MENKCLNELYKTCQKLASTDNFSNSEKNVFNYIIPIINSFNKLKNNTNDDEVLYSAISIISDIKGTKPELKGVVDAIIDIIKEPSNNRSISIIR